MARRFSMAGRRALVTGGSVSIGNAISIAFAEAGADVAIHYEAGADEAFGLPDAAGETAARIEALGRRTVLIDADFERSGEARRNRSRGRSRARRNRRARRLRLHSVSHVRFRTSRPSSSNASGASISLRRWN